MLSVTLPKAALARLVQFVAVVANIALCGACVPRELRSTSQRPELTELELLGEVRTSDAFSPSSAVPIADCALLTVDAHWGTLLIIDSAGEVGRAIWHPRVPLLGAKLAIGSDERVVMWSVVPNFLGFVATDPLDVHPVSVMDHAWGGSAIGPAVPMGTHHFAMTAIGDRSLPRRRPEPWRSTTLVDLYSERGHRIAGAGAVPEHEAKYLSSLLASSALGVVGDTLLVLQHADATVHAFVHATADSMALVRIVKLPHYFEQPPPREEVRTYPWIQYNGDVVRLTFAWPVGPAAFGPQGRLYAIRNYSMRWRPIAKGVLNRGGQWMPVDSGMEVYSAEGALLGAFDLGGRSVAWLRISNDGRVVIGDANGNLAVFRDPQGSSARRCRRVAGRVRLQKSDSGVFGVRSIAHDSVRTGEDLP